MATKKTAPAEKPAEKPTCPMVREFKAARAVSVPLLAIETADPVSTKLKLTQSFNGSAPPCLAWSMVRSFYPVNAPGKTALQETVQATKVDLSELTNPANPAWGNFLRALPEDSVVFAENLEAIFGEMGAAGISGQQAVRELREDFTADGKMLVLLCPSISVPPLLKDDLMTIEDPLPTRAELREVLREEYEKFKFPYTEADLVEGAERVVGLARFSADQDIATSMDLSTKRLDLKRLGEKKVRRVGQSEGLSALVSDITLANIGGMDGAKCYFTRRMTQARRQVRVILVVDEIDKSGLGGKSDEATDSGVTRDAIGQVLTTMEEKGWNGSILVGVAGGGKSFLAKALANEAGCPAIMVDFGAMKSKWVGESEGKIRSALRMVDAISGGEQVYVVGTCNKAINMDAALQRRFRDGIWYFDLLTKEERGILWGIYRAQYKIPDDEPTPPDEGWTGAEIRNVCEKAWDLRWTLKEAARYITPVCNIDAAGIAILREDAERARYLSALTGEAYVRPTGTPRPTAKPATTEDGLDLLTQAAKRGRKIKDA